MPTIPPTSSGSATTGAAGTKSPMSMGKEDFLQLLVAQLKNQDPSNAQDMEGMTQQMTQFGILEQLTNLSQATEKSSVLEMLGRTVTYQRPDGGVASGVVQYVDVSGEAPRLTVDDVSGIAPSSVLSVA
jgi:flagellar basal-body rod modification protein FlgD